MKTSEYTFSASSYKEWLQCGLKFRFKRIDRLPPGDEASHHRWFGRLVHEVIYAGLAERHGEKDYTPRAKAEKRYATSMLTSIWDGTPKDDVSRAIFEGAGEKPTVFSPGKTVALSTGDEKEWKKVARKMVGNGVGALSPVLPNIVEFEKELRFTYQEHNFVGYIDVLVKDSEGRYEFYDLKTAWNKPGKGLQNDFQFFIYSHALRQLYGLDYYPKGHWVHLKDGSLLSFEVTEEMVEKHAKEADMVFDRLEKDIYPASYGHPLCKFCDFRHICYGEDFDWDNWRPNVSY